MVKSFETPEDDTSREISITDIVVLLWDGKWIVIFTTVVFALMGLAYVFLSPKDRDWQLELRPITTSDFGAYRLLNGVVYGTSPEATKPFFPIARNALLERLAEELGSRSTFIQEIERSKFIDRAKYGSDDEFRNAVTMEAFKFKLVEQKRTADAGDETSAWLITYSGSVAPSTVRSILAGALSASTEQVRADLIVDFGRAVENRKRDNELGIKDADRKISNAIADYDLYVSNRIAGLKESAQIAHALGIEKNAIEVQNLAAGNSLVSSVQGDSPYYMRGYTAIEQEIRLIEGRKNNLAFVDGLTALQSAKRAFEQDDISARAQAAFDATPIVAGNFKASSYYVDGLDPPRSNSRSTVILLFSVVIGAALAILGLTVRNILRSRARNAV